MTSDLTLLIDLDDTLIQSGHTYNIPQLNCAKIISMEFQNDAPPPEEMIIEANKIRKSIMSNHLEKESPSAIWFEQSWLIYHKNLCEKLGRPVNNVIQGALFEAAKMWFLENYSLFDGVEDTLKSVPLPKILVTLGHPDIQNYKINNVKIEKYFQHIEIVRQKTTNVFKSIIQKYNLKSTIMIGDNLELDIKPAIEAGVGRVFHVLGALGQPALTEWGEYISFNYTPIKNFNEIRNYL